ncbi:hypothetical protein [Pandoraea commovens]|uniref:Uncharacterized protein n=1 Tax=Pandoraea commovens TaxID=2508289 RepID=A0A5E4XBA7_9BURK|nr:hypothetical protein [Pandoraea commovens]VVE33699.1 hypothetical protein PCO31010_03804 [Pandoraea commovens]
MNAPLPCIVTRDLGAYMHQQDAAEALAKAREYGAERADPQNALKRLEDDNYPAYLELLDALIKQDTKRAGEIMQAAFEAEVNVFAEGEVLA